MVAMLVSAMVLATVASRDSPAVLSNIVLPKDTAGRALITGEADVLVHNGSFHFYFNNWGDCPGLDCCGTRGGCASCCMSHTTDCTYFDNHTVVAYRSDDLKSFTPLGVVFSTGRFDALRGVSMFRPHLLYNPTTRKFVMWYKASCFACNGTGTPNQGWYGVATADSLAGPFRVEVDEVPGISGGDQFLFQDTDPNGDGHAYVVVMGKVQQLNASYTGVVPGAEVKIPRPPKPTSSGPPGGSGDNRWEAPVMFSGGVDAASGQRRYFIIGGHNCCACKGGSNAYVMTALGSPLGAWRYVDDIGENTTQCAMQRDPDGVCYQGGHSPLQWIDHAQTAAAFSIQEAGRNESTTVLLSNQWITAPEPLYARNADLLYWHAVRWDNTGMPQQIEWRDELELNLAA
jgi:hypothetical protein